MSRILDINYNHFHHLGRSQMCAAAWYIFSPSKPHSGTLWAVFCILPINLPSQAPTHPSDTQMLLLVKKDSTDNDDRFSEWNRIANVSLHYVTHSSLNNPIPSLRASLFHLKTPDLRSVGNKWCVPYYLAARQLKLSRNPVQKCCKNEPDTAAVAGQFSAAPGRVHQPDSGSITSWYRGTGGQSNL